MNFAYLIPFSYFARTRLSESSWLFHALFEWGAALALSAMFGTSDTIESMVFAVGSYFAFISLYEIGYMFNDLISSRKELSPRLRGPQGATSVWLGIWVFSRVLSFYAITMLLGVTNRIDWWLFFSAMLVVFFIHNYIQDKELKVITFLWLAWFRFLAPVIFVLQSSQRMGIVFGATSLYAVFRGFGYLDSKNLLIMPARKTMEFRVIYYLIPIAAVCATWGYEEAMAFRFLAVYFAVIAAIAWIIEGLKINIASNRNR